MKNVVGAFLKVTVLSYLGLTACGTGVQEASRQESFSISGVVKGLAGKGLELRNNDSDKILIVNPGDANSEVSFTFPTAVQNNAEYLVTVSVQPQERWQLCRVKNEKGTVRSASVNDIVITCENQVHQVGGVVTGLQGQGLLIKNGEEILPIERDAEFHFLSPVDSGDSYEIAVTEMPANPTQVCDLVNPSGTIQNTDISNIFIVCKTSRFPVGGKVAGLAAGNKLSLSNGTVTLEVATDGTFKFPPVDSGTPYRIFSSITGADILQRCSIANSVGIVTDKEVSDVQIACESFNSAGNALLKSIAISPDSPILPNTRAIQLTARGTFSDNNVYDISGYVNWTSANSDVVNVDTTGSVRANAVGSTLIIAQWANISGSTTVNVPRLSNAGLIPLSSWLNVSNWETFQGNASHTGYVPVTLAPNVFEERWSWKSPEAAASIGAVRGVSPITVAGGLLYVATGLKVYALKEYDAGSVWSYDFSGLKYPSVNPPAVSGGKVFVAAGQQSSTYMYGFDAKAGTLSFQTLMSSQWENYLTPTVFNGTVYQNSGMYGGLYSIDGTTGAQNYALGLDQFDGWTPAVDGNYAYVLLYGKFQVIDRLKGTIVSTIADPSYTWRGWTAKGSAVIGAADSVFATDRTGYANDNNALTDFKISTKSVVWSNKGNYVNNPGYNAKVIYALNMSPNRLEARSETDGALLWSWTPTPTTPGGTVVFTSDVLLTNNLAFVSTDTRTVAIDLVTHDVVWTYAHSGKLALSNNGVLYISDASAGTIYAINVKP